MERGKKLRMVVTKVMRIVVMKVVMKIVMMAVVGDEGLKKQCRLCGNRNTTVSMRQVVRQSVSPKAKPIFILHLPPFTFHPTSLLIHSFISQFKLFCLFLKAP